MIKDTRNRYGTSTLLLLLTAGLILAGAGLSQPAQTAPHTELKVNIIQEEGSPEAVAKVSLHNPLGMAAGELELVYDHEHFSFQEASPGKLLEDNGFSFQEHLAEEGRVKLGWFALEETSNSGPLFQATFRGENHQPLKVELQNIELYRSDGSQIPVGAHEIKLQIDQKEAWVNDTSTTLDAAPFIQEGRTMVPVRFVSEQLGGEVTWLEDTRQVKIQDDGQQILLTIDSVQALVGDQEQTLDSPAVIVSARTFVPLRFVSETLGAQVSWHEETKTITIALP